MPKDQINKPEHTLRSTQVTRTTACQDRTQVTVQTQHKRIMNKDAWACTYEKTHTHRLITWEQLCVGGLWTGEHLLLLFDEQSRLCRGGPADTQTCLRLSDFESFFDSDTKRDSNYLSPVCPHSEVNSHVIFWRDALWSSQIDNFMCRYFDAILKLASMYVIQLKTHI